jgi:MmyB-like transcription regulator ligand binding domain
VPDETPPGGQSLCGLSRPASDPNGSSRRSRSWLVASSPTTHHLARHDLPVGGTQRWHHPVAGELRLDAELLELPAADAQQLVVFLPADGTTADALVRLRPVPAATRLHVVSR